MERNGVAPDASMDLVQSVGLSITEIKSVAASFLRKTSRPSHTECDPEQVNAESSFGTQLWIGQ